MRYSTLIAGLSCLLVACGQEPTPPAPAGEHDRPDAEDAGPAPDDRPPAPEEPTHELLPLLDLDPSAWSPGDLRDLVALWTQEGLRPAGEVVEIRLTAQQPSARIGDLELSIPPEWLERWNLEAAFQVLALASDVPSSTGLAGDWMITAEHLDTWDWLELTLHTADIGPVILSRPGRAVHHQPALDLDSENENALGDEGGGAISPEEQGTDPGIHWVPDQLDSFRKADGTVVFASTSVARMKPRDLGGLVGRLTVRLGAVPTPCFVVWGDGRFKAITRATYLATRQQPPPAPASWNDTVIARVCDLHLLQRSYRARSNPLTITERGYAGHIAKIVTRLTDWGLPYKTYDHRTHRPVPIRWEERPRTRCGRTTALVGNWRLPSVQLFLDDSNPAAREDCTVVQGTDDPLLSFLGHEPTHAFVLLNLSAVVAAHASKAGLTPQQGRALWTRPHWLHEAFASWADEQMYDGQSTVGYRSNQAWFTTGLGAIQGQPHRARVPIAAKHDTWKFGSPGGYASQLLLDYLHERGARERGLGPLAAEVEFVGGLFGPWLKNDSPQCTAALKGTKDHPGTVCSSDWMDADQALAAAAGLIDPAKQSAGPSVKVDWMVGFFDSIYRCGLPGGPDRTKDLLGKTLAEVPGARPQGWIGAYQKMGIECRPHGSSGFQRITRFRDRCFVTRGPTCGNGGLQPTGITIDLLNANSTGLRQVNIGHPWPWEKGARLAAGATMEATWLDPGDEDRLPLDQVREAPVSLSKSGLPLGGGAPGNVALIAPDGTVTRLIPASPQDLEKSRLGKRIPLAWMEQMYGSGSLFTFEVNDARTVRPVRRPGEARTTPREYTFDANFLCGSGGLGPSQPPYSTVGCAGLTALVYLLRGDGTVQRYSLPVQDLPTRGSVHTLTVPLGDETRPLLVDEVAILVVNHADYDDHAGSVPWWTLEISRRRAMAAGRSYSLPPRKTIYGFGPSLGLRPPQACPKEQEKGPMGTCVCTQDPKDADTVWTSGHADWVGETYERAGEARCRMVPPCKADERYVESGNGTGTCTSCGGDAGRSFRSFYAQENARGHGECVRCDQAKASDTLIARWGDENNTALAGYEPGAVAHCGCPGDILPRQPDYDWVEALKTASCAFDCSRSGTSLPPVRFWDFKKAGCDLLSAQDSKAPTCCTGCKSQPTVDAWAPGGTKEDEFTECMACPTNELWATSVPAEECFDYGARKRVPRVGGGTREVPVHRPNEYLTRALGAPPFVFQDCPSKPIPSQRDVAHPRRCRCEYSPNGLSDPLSTHQGRACPCGPRMRDNGLECVCKDPRAKRVFYDGRVDCTCPTGEERTEQGACICPANQERVQGSCKPKCPASQERVGTVCKTKCPTIASRGSNGVCQCPGSFTYNSGQNSCECGPGKVVADGKCEWAPGEWGGMEWQAVYADGSIGASTGCGTNKLTTTQHGIKDPSGTTNFTWSRLNCCPESKYKQVEWPCGSGPPPDERELVCLTGPAKANFSCSSHGNTAAAFLAGTIPKMYQCPQGQSLKKAQDGTWYCK